MNNYVIFRELQLCSPLQTHPQYFQQPIAQLKYTLAVAAPTNYGLAPYYQKPTETTQYGGSPAPHAYPPYAYTYATPIQGQWSRPPSGGARLHP